MKFTIHFTINTVHRTDFLFFLPHAMYAQNMKSITVFIIIISSSSSHLSDGFIQSDLQMRTMEAIKINKRAMICKCYNKYQLA